MDAIQIWSFIVTDHTTYFPRLLAINWRYCVLVDLDHRLSSAILVVRKQSGDNFFQKARIDHPEYKPYKPYPKFLNQYLRTIVGSSSFCFWKFPFGRSRSLYSSCWPSLPSFLLSFGKASLSGTIRLGKLPFCSSTSGWVATEEQSPSGHGKIIFFRHPFGVLVEFFYGHTVKRYVELERPKKLCPPQKHSSSIPVLFGARFALKISLQIA